MKIGKPAKKVVLLVEDLPFDADLTQRALKKYEGQFDILVARDGWDALVLMKHQKFDLILLDLKMPRIDGFETMKLMNGYHLQHGVPLLILSNSDLQADRVQARKLGAAEYVQKSLDFSQFTNSLQVALARHGWA
jgi:DNA-binding response OmpR family regulator